MIYSNGMHLGHSKYATLCCIFSFDNRKEFVIRKDIYFIFHEKKSQLAIVLKLCF